MLGPESKKIEDVQQASQPAVLVTSESGGKGWQQTFQNTIQGKDKKSNLHLPDDEVFKSHLPTTFLPQLEMEKSKTSKPQEKEWNLQAFLEKVESRKIVEFKHWIVYLDQKQYYLGRTFIWAKRTTADDVATLTKAEWTEFHKILKMMKNVYMAEFQADKINVAFLGNDAPHCHAHLVPRYKTPRILAGLIFEDKNWGHNYSNANTKATEILTTDVYQIIKEILQKSIAKQEYKPKIKHIY